MLTDSSSKTGTTFKKTITQLSHPGPDDHEHASSPEFLARTPSTATFVDVFPTDVRSRKNSFEKEAEVLTPGLEFEHLTRRLLTTYFIYFVCGWGDGVTATVLPSFEKDFDLSYMTCSLLFTGSTVGSVVGTILLERIVNFLGQFYPSLNHCTYLPAVPFFDRLFTKDVSAALPCGVGYSPAKARFSSLVLGGLLHPLFFIIMGTARNYPSLLLAYAIAAFARSFWTASSNFYVVSTPKKPLGVLLGCWCIGSFSAPLVCQTLMAEGIPWKHFYLGSLVISVIALSLTIFSFRPTRHEFLADRNAALDAMRITPSVHGPGTDTMIHPSHEEKVRDSSAHRADARSPPNTLLLALSMPYQWAFSLFAFIYSGSETTFQGFIVTYLLTNRGSSSDTVGYVSSGFWGGMAAGRILWGYYCTGLTFTQRKHIIHACTGVAFLMTILIWFVNSTIVNALSSAVVGLMYGPIFPGTLGLCNDVLPKDVHMVSMAILTAVASAGSAVFPFMTGIISNIDGMRVFCYVTVSQTVAMFVLWLFFPSSPPVRVLNLA